MKAAPVRRQSAVMTRVLLTEALSGGSPLSHTRKGILITVPTGKLELMLQFFSPTLANSWPAGPHCMSYAASYAVLVKANVKVSPSML